MSSTIIVSTIHNIYKPLFDTETGTYKDVTPYLPYQRNRQYYECRCCAGKGFANNQEFKQHCKSKTHKEFVENYSKYYKEVDEAMDEIKSLRIKADKSERARLSSLRILNEKDREIGELSQRLEMISNMLEKLNTEKNLMIKYQLGFLEQFQRENTQ